MAMTHEKFEALVQKLEPFARRSPGQYRLRVGLLAVLGYVYLLAMLGIVVGLLALLAMAVLSGHAVILIKLGIPLMVVAGLILRALWVSLPPPAGPELRRDSAPGLFAMLDELSRRLHAPRLHHVQLDDEFNAGIVQIPRLGVFGWQRNFLILGLPLMEAVSPEQFRAVLAHEMGHLSGNHSRFSGWVYRVRLTWERLLESLLERRHAGLWLFTGFFGWYAPFFSAYSFVLARADEYVADRCAAEVTGRQTAAEALVAIQVKGHFLADKFWPQIAEQAQRQAEPPAALYASMFQNLRDGPADSDARRWLAQALAEKTGVDDTHPSLSDRLAALGCEAVPAVPPPPAETAAQRFLGPVAEQHRAFLDAQWRRQIAPRWKEQHQEALKGQSVLDALERKASEGGLTEGEAWDRARLTAELRGGEAALPLLSEFSASHPDHALAAYALGFLLLEQGDAQGLAHLERAMAREADGVLPACEAAYDFLRRRGQETEANAYRARAEQHLEKLALAQAEREQVDRKDRFFEHGLGDDVLAVMRGPLGHQALVRQSVSRPQGRHPLPGQAAFRPGAGPAQAVFVRRRRQEAGPGPADFRRIGGGGPGPAARDADRPDRRAARLAGDHRPLPSPAH